MVVEEDELMLPSDEILYEMLLSLPYFLKISSPSTSNTYD